MSRHQLKHFPDMFFTEHSFSPELGNLFTELKILYKRNRPISHLQTSCCTEYSVATAES